MHKPIQIKNLSLSFPHKLCFENFSTQVYSGSRIAIIGANGSGKSTLLNRLNGISNAVSGEVMLPSEVVLGYVPQLISDHPHLSGAERFQKSLTQALQSGPNVLLLDEPTNHLDRTHRKNFLGLLEKYTGTLILVSHDTMLLRHSVDILWHIDNGTVHIFSGNYEDYKNEIISKRRAIEASLLQLHRQKKEMHQTLMREQVRAAKSRAKGEKSIRERKWPLGGKATALRAEETSGRKKVVIQDKKQALIEQLADLRLPDIIQPKFSLSSAELGDKVLVSISEGGVTYCVEKTVLKNIYLTIRSHSRLAILGDNGSGKSTLVKAILNEPIVIKTGDWLAPNRKDIGYLDQQYAILCPNKTVFETIADEMPEWREAEIRKHLNDFLFRKNEEVEIAVSQLSGGERVRLSLARIAVLNPKLLILDEVTNNLDLETKAHVVTVLKAYPGALIVISHDEDFLEAIDIRESYCLG